MNIDDLLGVVNHLQQAGEEPHSVMNCRSPGCPAVLSYEEIVHEGETGTMFVIQNVLVWISADDLAFDRESQQVHMCMGKAITRGFVS